MDVSLVTYSNEMKKNMGVQSETLAQFGAVSRECAFGNYTRHML